MFQEKIDGGEERIEEKGEVEAEEKGDVKAEEKADVKAEEEEGKTDDPQEPTEIYVDEDRPGHSGWKVKCVKMCVCHCVCVYNVSLCV